MVPFTPVTPGDGAVDIFSSAGVSPISGPHSGPGHPNDQPI